MVGEQSFKALLACVQDDPVKGGAQGPLWEMTSDPHPQARLGQEMRSEGREERVKADGRWGHGGAPPETENWECSVRGELLEDLTGHPGGAVGGTGLEPHICPQASPRRGQRVEVSQTGS